MEKWTKSFQTSTGRGHEYRPGYYFPASDFKGTIGNPLPPPVATQEEIIKPYVTTTGEVHDHKFSGGGLANPIHKKAGGNWKVHYNKDLREKLQNRQWRRELTMGNEESEMKANYKALPGITTKADYMSNPQPPLLSNHHVNGPLKHSVASGGNAAAKGRTFYARDPAVLTHLDPYITTTHKEIRPFTKSELVGYPKKDCATYWRCEDYPQAWGHGTKENPLPAGSVPRERPSPMRDSTWFQTARKEPVRWPEQLKRVPHDGIRSSYQSNYIAPSHPRMSENFHCPVDTPWVIPNPGPPEIMAVPHMYNTEYSTYASGQPVSI